MSRRVVMTTFLAVPLTSAGAIVFGAVMGLLWLSTGPLTSGPVATMFDPLYLSSLFGHAFLSHQVGAFLGERVRVFDTTGSYDPVWTLAVVLGVIAAVIHIPIAVGDDRSPAPSMAS